MTQKTIKVPIAPRRKILIVGGGTVGLTCYRILASQNNVQFVETNSQHPHADHEDCILSDEFFDHPERFFEGAGYEYCINTAPVYEPSSVRKVVETCVLHGVHYLDFSEDVHAAAEIKDYCEGRELSTLVAPHCGLAPGLIQIIANDLAEQFDEVEGIEMNVGSLPLSANNPLNYLTMWSTEGIVNEYSKPATIIIAGKKETHEPLSFRIDLMINGKPYEAFLTSGGCSTLLDTWEGRAQRVFYRTIRYPGHLKAMGAFIEEGEHRKSVKLSPNFLRALKCLTPLTPTKDVVVILVTVYGIVNGEQRMDQFTAEVYGEDTYGLSAIQRLTAGSGAAVFDLHSRGLIKQNGLLRQEEISLETLRKSFFYSALGL